MNRELKGERLKRSASADRVEPFAFMLSDGTFGNTADFYGRLSVVDRFLSNFHKPLQRRMLFTDPDVPLTTKVVQHVITKEVYLIGQERSDSDGTKAYERLNVVHLVSNESSTYTEVYKWVPATLTLPPEQDENEMILVRENLGKFFLSMEYQSSRTEQYSDNEQSTRMLFYASPELLSVVDETSEFQYLGKWWSIKQAFSDSAFASGTLVDSGQGLEEFAIIYPVNKYDPATQKWDILSGASIKKFSGSWGEDDSDMSSKNVGTSSSRILYAKTQFIYADRFKAGQVVMDSEGKLWQIRSIRNNKKTPDVRLTLARIYSVS